jgi:mRNA interferase YafQ
MFTKRTSNQFERDYVKQYKRSKDISKLDKVMKLILTGKPLPQKYKDHPLKGNWQGYRECHIEPNWLLVYKPEETEVLFERTGTHPDLFK